MLSKQNNKNQRQQKYIPWSDNHSNNNNDSDNSNNNDNDKNNHDNYNDKFTFAWWRSASEARFAYTFKIWWQIYTVCCFRITIIPLNTFVNICSENNIKRSLL